MTENNMWAQSFFWQVFLLPFMPFFLLTGKILGQCLPLFGWPPFTSHFIGAQIIGQGGRVIFSPQGFLVQTRFCGKAEFGICLKHHGFWANTIYFEWVIWVMHQSCIIYSIQILLVFQWPYIAVNISMSIFNARHKENICNIWMLSGW